MNYTFESINSTSLSELTHIWNRCWQGYTFNFKYTPDQMRVWLELVGVSLPASLLLKVGGRAVGLALLALEGRQGWLAGAAIAPEYRGHGLFAPLIKAEMAVAQRLGLKRIQLEVLTDNFAQRVYAATGFRYQRPLHIYRFERTNSIVNQKLVPGSLRKVPLDDYFGVRIQSGFSPSWQRRESCLRRYPDLTAYLEDAGRMGVLVSGAGKVLLDTWSVDVKSAANLRQFFPSIEGQILRNQPVDALANFLSSISLEPFAAQYEMALDF
ncbi:GNAT family N-acetyltransferase [Paradesulfitobacterium ferrireducens]|uniref:GNAT family N-acetyltransferase n=1 Tax=Paradesulfitobacterium ferrireducens TaxID=2816476 RepID=UPI001A8E5FD7|nr:GNAT family N-acetyltransferase [Paradesulfitobacterium ferrireducens]